MEFENMEIRIKMAELAGNGNDEIIFGERARHVIGVAVIRALRSVMNNSKFATAESWIRPFKESYTMQLRLEPIVRLAIHNVTETWKIGSQDEGKITKMEHDEFLEFLGLTPSPTKKKRTREEVHGAYWWIKKKMDTLQVGDEAVEEYRGSFKNTKSIERYLRYLSNEKWGIYSAFCEAYVDKATNKMYMRVSRKLGYDKDKYKTGRGGDRRHAGEKAVQVQAQQN